MTPVEFAKQAGRCWKGYEPVPGKTPYSNDSCRPAGSDKKKKSTTSGTQVPNQQKAADHVLFARQLANQTNVATLKVANFANLGRMVSKSFAPTVAKPSTAKRIGDFAMDWAAPLSAGAGATATARSQDLDWGTSLLLGASAASVASPRDYTRAWRAGLANARATGTAPVSGIMSELKPQLKNKAVLAGLSLVPAGAGLALNTVKNVEQGSKNLVDATGDVKNVSTAWKDSITSKDIDPATGRPRGEIAKMQQITNNIANMADSLPKFKDPAVLTKLVESLGGIADNVQQYTQPGSIKNPDGTTSTVPPADLGTTIRNAVTKDTLLDAKSPYTWGLGAAAVGIPSVAALLYAAANRKKRRRRVVAADL